MGDVFHGTVRRRFEAPGEPPAGRFTVEIPDWMFRLLNRTRQDGQTFGERVTECLRADGEDG